ncbi:MAG: hypothetical protein AB7J32_12160 [Pseudonocardia sp.]
MSQTPGPRAARRVGMAEVVCTAARPWQVPARRFGPLGPLGARSPRERAR